MNVLPRLDIKGASYETFQAQAPSPACNIVTGLLTGGFSWSRSYTFVPSTVTLAPVSTNASKGVQGDPLHLDPDRKRRRGHIYSTVMHWPLSFSPRVPLLRTPWACPWLPSTSSALVLVVNLLLTLLLTLGNSLFVRREQHWTGGCLEPHPQSTTLPPLPSHAESEFGVSDS